jgi:predicted carbohydrate-binding protein with CBM5 and CBM33 domain
MSEVKRGAGVRTAGRPRLRAGHKAGISALLAAVIGATVGLLATSAPEVDAHGSTQAPASRVYACRFTQPSNAMCAAASEANPQAIYDWMEVNIGDADGRHRELIPDGELCSAGREKYAAFDTPGEWPLTHLTPNQSGQHEIIFESTAPHATAYYRVYLTRPGFDARTDRLSWSDLEEVHDSGPMAASSEARFNVSLPDRAAPAILYVVWQRSDSPEAFYACSDVTIEGSPGGASPGDEDNGTTTTTSPPAPTTTGPGTPDDDHEHEDPEHGDSGSPEHDGHDGHEHGPSEPPIGGSSDGIDVSAVHTAEWDTGRCTTVGVHNTTGSAVTWEVHYEPGGSLDTVWNAEVSDGHMFRGESWNAEVAPGSTTSFGMCVSY